MLPPSPAASLNSAGTKLDTGNLKTKLSKYYQENGKGSMQISTSSHPQDIFIDDR